MLPAFFLVLLATKLLRTERGAALWNRITIGIRPVVVGLIFYAAYNIAKTELVVLDAGSIAIRPIGVLLAVIGFLGVRKLKLHPVVLIGVAAVLGAIFGV